MTMGLGLEAWIGQLGRRRGVEKSVSAMAEVRRIVVVLGEQGVAGEGTNARWG